MNAIDRYYKRLLIAFLLLSLLIPGRLLAQSATPTPTPQEALVQAIEARAQRDADLGRSPQGITALDTLFGDEARQVGITPNQLLTIYEEAYAAAQTPTPWWANLEPQMGWIVAAIFFVLFIIRDVLKEYLTRLVRWLGESAYQRLAGFRLFWHIALHRYCKQLVEAYQELIVPFRPDRPLPMAEVYVPLKVSGRRDTELIDAYAAVSQHRRQVILGEPGAGKSMLLRQITLAYAQEGLAGFPRQLIPILLELHRLNENEESLQDHLVQALGRQGFPNANRFIGSNLERGQLLLLFDGLDEVSQANRPRVVQQIKDLTGQHRDCHAIVTCRTAVYQNELNDWTQTLELVEFNDRQIQQFMQAWQTGMPPGKSVENLLRNLRERPRIMALARNPLLLTIIAYLYTDTPFIIPHSRAEFYETAVGQLLQQWKQERNQYKANHKGLVLQHLALYNQTRPGGSQQDRRSFSLPEILEQITKVLPSLTLDTKVAQPLLDEIVERSGLLIKIDGGRRYQFAHHKCQLKPMW
jgi:hypothetical protein